MPNRVSTLSKPAATTHNPYLLDTPRRKHLPHIAPNPHQLHPYMRTSRDHIGGAIAKLWRVARLIKHGIGGYALLRHEAIERAHLGEKTHLVHGCHHRVDRLPAEWPVHDRFVVDCEFGVAAPRDDLAERDLLVVDHADDEELACAGAFHVRVQLVDEVVAHVRAEVGGVEGYGLFELADEEHCKGVCVCVVGGEGAEGSCVCVCVREARWGGGGGGGGGSGRRAQGGGEGG